MNLTANDQRPARPVAPALEFLMEEGYDHIPRGYVLHYDYDNGHFQLIREDIHRIFTHYGGLYYNQSN